MIYKYSNFIGVFSLLFIFLTGIIPITYASVDMEELQAKFMKETGKQWSKATSEERSDFMYKIRGRKKKEEREERVAGVKTPYYIREGYRKKYQMEWEDATEEEQDKFIEEYKKLIIKWEREEKKRLKDEERRLKKIQREKEQKEREIKRKKVERERKIELMIKEKRRKRKEEKRKLEDAKRKIIQMRNKAKSRR